MTKTPATPPLDPRPLSDAFRERYRAYAKRVDAVLDRVLPPADRWPVVLHEAMRYSVFSGGKRLRPVLVLATCDLLGGDLELALPAAAAVELVHTYSLVHDDLPAMDDDAFRRGRPTTHVVYGEAMAILVGDALLTHAFALLSDPAWPVEPATALQVTMELARAAGSQGLIAGQVADLAAERGRDLDAKEIGALAASSNPVERIHRHKTGQLFRACVRMGARIAGAVPADVQRLTRYAEHFGLAFQIVDDILDVVGDERETGKRVGSDQKRGKLTFVSAYGLEEARARARAAAATAHTALAEFGPEADFLRDLVTFAVERTA